MRTLILSTVLLLAICASSRDAICASSRDAICASSRDGSAQTYLGNLSANPHAPRSTADPARRLDPNSVTNPYGRYGSALSPHSATNPLATDTPTLRDSRGAYRGKLSANPYDADSVSNPYGRYGSPYSPDSINNPYGAGSRFAPDSPRNPFGQGLEIFGED